MDLRTTMRVLGLCCLTGCVVSGSFACGGLELAGPSSAQDASAADARTGGIAGRAGAGGQGGAAGHGPASAGGSAGAADRSSGGAADAAGGSGAGGARGDRDATVHDGPVVDASRLDAHQADGSDGDAARESGRDDGGTAPRCSPLPDGSGRLTFVASGGASLDIRLGNDGTCDSAWSQGTDLFLVFFVPVPLGDAGGNPTGILSVQVPGAPPGLTGAGLLAAVDLLMSGHIWRSGTACTATVTGNELVGSGPSYKLTGSVNCTAALPETGGREPLTIVQFDFVASATTQ